MDFFLDPREKETVNLVFYESSVTKIKFVSELINSYKVPIFYIDFDLMFSGYYESGLISKIPDIRIFRPDRNNLLEIISEIIKKTSLDTSIIILDSLNNLYSILNDEPNSGRLVNSLLMFLSYNAKFSKSKVFIASLSEKKENEWVLFPTKRHILEIENMNRFYIEEKSEKLQIQKL
tara:strand:- start:224 stop:754 length:531 start_codon:yes stop_codon:yes gene_type:complete